MSAITVDSLAMSSLRLEGDQLESEPVFSFEDVAFWSELQDGIDSRMADGLLSTQLLYPPTQPVLNYTYPEVITIPAYEPFAEPEPEVRVSEAEVVTSQSSIPLTLRLKVFRQEPPLMAMVVGDTVLMPVPINPTCSQTASMLEWAQIWAPRAMTSDYQALMPVSLYMGLAMRPPQGSKNGLVLKTKEAAESVTFAHCCSRAAGPKVCQRHVYSVVEHYPRLREYALGLIGFKIFKCRHCKLKGTRWDSFKRSHLRMICKGRDRDSSYFLYDIRDSSAYPTVHNYVALRRDRLIDAALHQLKAYPITDAIVADVVAAWDVVPDRICHYLRGAGYYCFSEESVEARDLAADAAARAL